VQRELEHLESKRAEHKRLEPEQQPQEEVELKMPGQMHLALDLQQRTLVANTLVHHRDQNHHNLGT
jgi:hypothetical protein